MKPERWGSALVQEKHQEEKACDKRHTYRIIIIIIIIIINFTISGDRNMFKKKAEKILKYKDLTIETQRMWNVKTKVIPVIIGAAGIVTRSLRKNLETVPGKHSID